MIFTVTLTSKKGTTIRTFNAINEAMLRGMLERVWPGYRIDKVQPEADESFAEFEERTRDPRQDDADLLHAPPQCMCESSVCDHGDGKCSRPGTIAAPVQYLEGSPMCPHCVEHYKQAGYGIETLDSLPADVAADYGELALGSDVAPNGADEAYLESR